MTESQWLETLAVWADVWPSRKLPTSSVGTWFTLLADLDGDDVLAALVAWANDPDRVWPPASPGELRGEVERDDEPWTDALADLALTVRRHGRYAPRPDLPPVLDAYVDSMGGWTATCGRFDPADPTIRAQFRDHHAAVSRRARRDAAAALSTVIVPALENPHG